jgi:predicted Zn-dependent protease with MMP-like domain
MTRRTRDRHGRGLRGPEFGPAAGTRDLAVDGVPAQRSPGERFDALALAVMEELWQRFPDELRHVQLGVEEVPLLPDTWTVDTVPLASYVASTGDAPARVVLLRRPLEHRAESRADLEALVLTVLVEQVAEVLGLPPEDVHPDYDAG